MHTCGWHSKIKLKTCTQNRLTQTVVTRYCFFFQLRLLGSPGAFMSNPAVMVSFFPEFKGNMKQVPCEFIFVVDRSRSMSGQYIKEAAKALMLFLKSLPEACYFNIVGFGSRFETLFPESVPYNQSNLDKAIAHTEDLKADLVGGTHLYSPLEYIFSQPLHSHLTRQVFILTDGSVRNTAQVIGLVRKNASKARCVCMYAWWMEDSSLCVLYPCSCGSLL